VRIRIEIHNPNIKRTGIQFSGGTMIKVIVIDPVTLSEKVVGLSRKGSLGRASLGAIEEGMESQVDNLLGHTRLLLTD
jgi:hypothetical protein